MKNILVLNYEFPPLGWWQANANYYIFKEFSKNKNFSFTLITSSSDKYFEEVFFDNIKIYYLDIWKKWQNLHNQSIKNLLINAYKTYKLSKQLLKEKKYDSIMCWSYPAIVIWYIFKKIYWLDYITLLRWSDVPFYEKKWKNLDRFIFKYFAPIFWKNSKYVIANSQDLKKLALNISPNQEIKIITNWVDLEEFNKEKNKSKNIFNIIFVWRLTERKGIKELLQAYNIFSNNKNDVRLNIVWNWELFESSKQFMMKNNLSEKIIFHWLKKHNEIVNIYNSSDIYILPSSNEGMSNTLLEALASSLPVIITNVGWTKELFDKNGWIIEIWNSHDIVEKLDLAYDLWLNWELENLWKKSFEIVSSMSWENKAKDFIKYFKN